MYIYISFCIRQFKTLAFHLDSFLGLNKLTSNLFGMLGPNIGNTIHLSTCMSLNLLSTREVLTSLLGHVDDKMVIRYPKPPYSPKKNIIQDRIYDSLYGK